jgi:hypothetical protein
MVAGVAQAPANAVAEYGEDHAGRDCRPDTGCAVLNYEATPWMNSHAARRMKKKVGRRFSTCNPWTATTALHAPKPTSVGHGPHGLTDRPFLGGKLTVSAALSPRLAP